MWNYKNYGRLWRVYGRSTLKYGTPRKLWNALRTEWAYRHRHTDVRSAPYLLNIEPLYYCNLDCPLCDRQIFPEARPDAEAGRLPLDIVDKIFEEVGDYLYQCQIFGQGEPLLDWPRTQQIIEKARKKRIFTLLSTNCTVLTPKMAEEVVGSGLDYLVCAVDGIRQESYGKYRVGGQVERALANMRLFAEERRRQRRPMEIEWQFLVNRHNIDELEEARRIADDLGVFLRFSPIRGMEFDERLQKEWLPDTAEWQDGRIDPGQTCYSWPCYFLWRALIVNSNARVARCLIYQNVGEYGSLHEDSVLGLFNSPESQHARQLFQKGPVPDGPFPSPCANCSFYAREHGGPNLGKRDSLEPLPAFREERGTVPLKVLS